MKIYKFVFLFIITFFENISSGILSSEGNKQNSNNLQNSNRTISLPLDNTNNLIYSSKVYIGPSSQPFNLVFDTLSTFIQIPSKECSNCLNQNLFDCSDPTICKDKKNQTNYYILGKLDTISFEAKQSVSFPFNLALPSQNILFVLQIINLNNFKSDGSCGLNFEAIFKNDENNFLVQLYKTKQINTKVFSFYLSNQAYSAPIETSHSKIILGGEKANLYISPLKELPLNDEKNWAIKLTNFEFDQNVIFTGVANAIINIADHMLQVPYNVYMKILNNLKNSFTACETVGINIKCLCPKGLKLFPILQFTFGEEKFELEPEFYISEQNFVCLIQIKSSDYENQNNWIIGNSFFKKYYSVFDADNKKIKLAKAQNKEPAYNVLFNDIIYLFAFLFASFFIGILIVFIVNKKTGLHEIVDEVDYKHFS